MDIATEPDDVAKAQFLEECEQLMVTEAAICEDRDRNSRRQDLGQPKQTDVFKLIAPTRQLLLPDRQPQKRRRPAMPRHQAQDQRRLPITVEIGPVHGDDDLGARTHQIRNPARKARPNINLLITQQAVDLLDRMLRHQAPRQRQTLANHRHRQRRARHDPKRRRSQRIHPLGMKVVIVDTVNERPNILQLAAKPPIYLIHNAPKQNYQHIGV
jgi:hypothetical protein